MSNETTKEQRAPDFEVVRFCDGVRQAIPVWTNRHEQGYLTFTCGKLQLSRFDEERKEWTPLKYYTDRGGTNLSLAALANEVDRQIQDRREQDREQRRRAREVTQPTNHNHHGEAANTAAGQPRVS